MILLEKIIAPERIVSNASISSKKRTLESLSEMIVAGESNLSQNEVFESLCERERLGSTGLGHGIAIPHGRIENLTVPLGAFLQLEKGIEYDAVDKKPVDLICALVVPQDSNEEHLEILAVLAEMFGSEEACNNLREKESREEIFQLLTQWKPSAANRSV